MRGSRFPDDFWENRRPLITSMLSRGMPYSQIAAHVGTAASTVAAACQRMGIDKSLPVGRETASAGECRDKPLSFFEIRRIDQLILEGWVPPYAVEEVTGFDAVKRIF